MHGERRPGLVEAPVARTFHDVCGERDAFCVDGLEPVDILEYLSEVGTEACSRLLVETQVRQGGDAVDVVWAEASHRRHLSNPLEPGRSAPRPLHPPQPAASSAYNDGVLHRRRFRLSLWALPLALLLITPGDSQAWGFEAHKFIAEQVISRLPPGIRELFERQRTSFVEHSIDPDLWRNVGFEEEPPRHFLDLDAYGPPPFDALPHSYDEAVAKFGPEKVNEEGTLPWRIAEIHGRLRRTFEQLARPDGPGYAQDNVVFFASVLSHYIGDAHVPFHAVVNYDGQVTGQHGIHSRFESELFTRMRPRLTIAPRSLVPVSQPREVAFATLIDGTRLATQVLEADRQAIGAGDLYDDGYFARFAEAGAGPILEQRINESIAAVVAHIVGAWEAAGKPDLSTPRPPRGPQRKRAPRPATP